MTTEDAQAAEKVALADAERIIAEAIVDRVTWDDGTEYINVKDAARLLAEAVERERAKTADAWKVAAQRRNEGRRYYLAWRVARMRAAAYARLLDGKATP